MLLLVGIVLGCYNAWRVIQKELNLHDLDDQSHSRPERRKE
jgi:hypothetical protein